MRGANQIQANGLLFGSRIQKDSVEPKIGEAEKQALELKQEKQEWFAKGGRIEQQDGNIIWKFMGDCHRDNDKPALIRANGDQEWWYIGKRHRDNGPAVVYANGDKEWWQNDRLHRENDLPAIEDVNGFRQWNIKGRRHRANGPAVIREDGKVEYWLDGVRQDYDI